MIKNELESVDAFRRKSKCLHQTTDDSGFEHFTYAIGELFIQFHVGEDSYSNQDVVFGISFVTPVVKEVTSYE